MNRNVNSERLIDNYKLQYFMLIEGQNNDQKNLPPGWVLQGKSEQGMSSLSLLPENEELATASCGSNLYPNNMAMS